jgi:hypothetical protein
VRGIRKGVQREIGDAVTREVLRERGPRSEHDAFGGDAPVSAAARRFCVASKLSSASHRTLPETVESRFIQRE